MTIMWFWNAKKKRSLWHLATGLPTEIVHLQIYTLRKACVQGRKFFPGRKGGKAHKPAGTQRGGNNGRPGGEPQQLLSPHIPTHTNSLFSPAHTPAGTVWKGAELSRCCAARLHKERKWRPEERGRNKKEKGGQTPSLHPHGPSTESACGATTPDWLLWLYTKIRASFRINKISFVTCLPVGAHDTWCASNRSC